MKTPTASTAETAFRALLRTVGLVRRVMEPYFTQFGLSGAQWGAMRALRRAEQEGQAGLRLTDLSDRLLIRPPSVTGVVDRLQRMGHVARVDSATDHRSKQVSLTSSGRELVERVQKGHRSQIEAVLAGLSRPEQETFERLLDQLGSHLRDLTGPEDGTSAS
jgi:DNA-binding MarR family transcriptional regulator